MACISSIRNRTIETTTYNKTKAIEAFKKGLDIYVFHPDDKDCLMESISDIQDAKGHMFGWRT